MSRIRRGSRLTLLGVLASSAILAGCDAPYQIFSSASEAAARVTRIAWFLIALAAVVYIGVMILMLVSFTRNRDRSETSVDLSDPGVGWLVWGGAVMPAVVLGAVFLVAMTAMGRYPHDKPVLSINVTGHQWGWEFEYAYPELKARFKTANEIHIPVNQPVRLFLTTADVIHSFWVPQLQGKLDLIPGDTNDLRLVARTPGVYRGECSEYCGTEHARMRLIVIAEDSASFNRWVSGQLADATAPADSMEALGQREFVGGPCALCHTVGGTPANGKLGPDLTHVGSRLTIAAGTAPNTLGNLEAWIANAQSLKPGTKMPTITQYNGQELRALAAYVASLK